MTTLPLPTARPTGRGAAALLLALALFASALPSGFSGRGSPDVGALGVGAPVPSGWDSYGSAWASATTPGARQDAAQAPRSWLPDLSPAMLGLSGPTPLSESAPRLRLLLWGRLLLEGG